MHQNKTALDHHSVSLGTDPPSKPQPSFFCPGGTENVTSPSQVKKSPDNLNMLHMFHNNIYAFTLI